MRILFSVTVLCFALAVAGCSNTFDGVGRDLEKAGEKIQETF